MENEERLADIVVVVGVIAAFYLKLSGIWKISWFWFLSPLWIFAAILALIAISVAINHLYYTLKEKKKRK